MVGGATGDAGMLYVTPLLAVALFSGVATASDDPRAVGEAFCKARLGNDEAATLGLLTPSLKEAIKEAEARRKVYVDYLVTRLASRQSFLEEALRARSLHL